MLSTPLSRDWPAAVGVEASCGIAFRLINIVGLQHLFKGSLICALNVRFQLVRLQQLAWSDFR